MNVEDYYQEGRYKVAESDRVELARFYAKRFITISNALEGYSFKKVLDAGCGDGELGKMLKEQRHVDVYGVDISKKGVALANKKGLHARVGDISAKIPFDRNTFDLVVASETIEHVVSPDIFLKEIHRVLRPGGKLLLTTPNLSSWLNRALFLFGLYPLFLEASTEAKVGYGKYKKFFYSMQLVGHIHVFNLRALRELLQYHKFSVECIQGNTVDFVTPRSQLITQIYQTIDKIFAHFASLSSDLVVIARKQEEKKQENDNSIKT